MKDNIFIKKYIKNNRDKVWTYFANKPSFDILNVNNNFKHILFMRTVENIIYWLYLLALKPYLWDRKLTDLIKLVLCQEFVIYFNKIWDDVSSAIKNNAEDTIVVIIPRLGSPEKVFTEYHRTKILEILRKISR